MPTPRNQFQQYRQVLVSLLNPLAWLLGVFIAVQLPFILGFCFGQLQSQHFLPTLSGPVSDLPTFAIFILDAVAGNWGTITITVILLQLLAFRDSFWLFGFNKDVAQIRWGLLVALIGIVVIAGVEWIFGKYQVTGTVFEFNTFQQIFWIIIVSLISAFGAGFFEELLFRGLYIKLFACCVESMLIGWDIASFLPKRIREIPTLPTGIAILLSSLLFACVHVPFYPNIPPYMVLMLTTLAGITFSAAYLLSKTLWLPIGIHFGWDLFVSWLGVLGSSPDKATVLVTQVSATSSQIVVIQMLALITITLIINWLHKRREMVVGFAETS